MFEEVLLTRVLNTKKVLLVKESFSDLLYVLRIDISHSFTACSQMSLQIGCSVEGSVTIRATKVLEDCGNVAQVTYRVCVSQHVLQYSRDSAHSP